MVVLLDTCVLSELQKQEPNREVVRYLSTFHAHETFVSAVSVGKIWFGIQLLAESKRRRTLDLWIQSLKDQYRDRILFVNTDVAQVWGEIAAKSRKQGRVLAPADGLIAAMALQHGLRVVTRNVKDFESTGVLTVNPWETG